MKANLQSLFCFGRGRGNWGHKGRPGQVGGSARDSSYSRSTRTGGKVEIEETPDGKFKVYSREMQGKMLLDQYDNVDDAIDAVDDAVGDVSEKMPEFGPYAGHKDRNIDGINWGGRGGEDGFSFSGDGYYGNVYQSASRATYKTLGRSGWISMFGLNKQNNTVLQGDLPGGYFSSKDLAMKAAEDAYVKWSKLPKQKSVLDDPWLAKYRR